MTYILMRQQVADFNNWKRAFDEFVEYRRIGGEITYQIFHPNDQPNELILLFQWESIDSAREFLDSNSVKLNRMQSGVSKQVEIQFLEMIEKGKLS